MLGGAVRLAMYLLNQLRVELEVPSNIYMLQEFLVNLRFPPTFTPSPMGTKEFLLDRGKQLLHDF
jgi:hypothetical protein